LNVRRFEDESRRNAGGRHRRLTSLVTLEEALTRIGRTVQRASHGGRSVKTETHQVKFPPGGDRGQKLRLAGRGETGAGGGAAGDLYLRVRLPSIPTSEVEDHNLIFTKPSWAPWEAVLARTFPCPRWTSGEHQKFRPAPKTARSFRVRAAACRRATARAGDLMVVTARPCGSKSPTQRKNYGTARARVQIHPRIFKV